MPFLIALTLLSFCCCRLAGAQALSFFPDATLSALQEELSGETAKRTLNAITLHHRMRGSQGYRAALDHIHTLLRGYGMTRSEIMRFPTDGIIMYGTQRSRPAWNAEFAELWEVRESGGNLVRTDRLASWSAMPLTLAQDSRSGRATGLLVDVGAGTSDADYQGKIITGALVLTSSQPGAVAPLAVKKYGASGIISYAQNQKTAWWKENEHLIRWGHLETFSEIRTFAFMVSLKQARTFQERLRRGDTILLEAHVVADQQPGSYDILTTIIEGRDSILKHQEIVFTCHLDHPMPGANDNASGSVAILEVARALHTLIESGRIERPRRTLRFVWSPEIEGSLAFLNGKPEIATRLKAAVHMDMVGGGPETKALFHVSRAPRSLPSFVNDIGEMFGSFLNAQSAAFASGETSSFPFVSKEGGKEALQAVLGSFRMGSDHDVYNEGSFRIPTIYLHDWPDRYIHTNYDVPANIDPTKLKRAAFIGGASAYVLANLSLHEVAPLEQLLKAQIFKRTAGLLDRIHLLPLQESANAIYHHWRYERDVIASVGYFFPLPEVSWKALEQFLKKLEETWEKGTPLRHTFNGGQQVYVRNPEIKGTLSAFGYDYLHDHYGGEKVAALRLLRHEGLFGGGSEYAYEALNLVDGKRTVIEIRNALAAEFGPVPVEFVDEYLAALRSINVVQTRP